LQPAFGSELASAADTCRRPVAEPPALAARENRLVTVGFTRSDPTTMNSLCDVVIGAPSDETALIQQIHITVGHAICHLVEREMFGAARG
jgi:D-sedoheptulose 7-phosphate isomerase